MERVHPDIPGEILVTFPVGGVFEDVFPDSVQIFAVSYDVLVKPSEPGKLSISGIVDLLCGLRLEAPYDFAQCAFRILHKQPCCSCVFFPVGVSMDLINLVHTRWSRRFVFDRTPRYLDDSMNMIWHDLVNVQRYFRKVRGDSLPARFNNSACR